MYGSNDELPEGVQNVLPDHAQDIYREAYNSAREQYQDPNKREDRTESAEEVAHQVAWGAVKKMYTRNADSGKWEKND